MLALTLLLGLAAPAQMDKSERDRQIENTRSVLAAIVRTARDNSRQVRPLRNDALTTALVRAAAREARRLPEAESVPAFALALGVALDTSQFVRSNPLVALTWRRIETNAERQARLEVLGRPTLHGRQDLAQHFAVSMALTALLGEARAEEIGLLKELLDAGEGGSGFSFADLAANLGGITLTRRLLDRPAQLSELARRFDPVDYTLAPRGLVEGLSRAEFQKRYGGVRDPRFRKVRDDLLSRLRALPGHRHDCSTEG